LISGGFLISGTLITFTYNYPVIRYGIIVVLMVAAIIRRRDVIRLVKEIAEMKGKK
jgi:hypothetical protein